MTSSEKNYPRVPVELDELAGFSTDCPCGRTHAVDTRIFLLEQGGLSQVPDVVAQVAGGRVGVLVDRVTQDIAGNAVMDGLRRDNRDVTCFIVPDGEGNRPHATWENVLLVREQMEGCDVVVAVGSGTINDLAKLSSFQLGVPYVTVPTAASMNGYTSAIAAIMKDGLKQTIDCHQPLAVVADLDVLAAAPAELTAAGLGDLESKPVCTADFLLSSLVRHTYYCPVPGDVVAVAEKRASACAKGIGAGEPDAIEALTRALLLSGCSMKLAGSSSPASGGEHLVSHYWDMIAPEEGRVEGWHGAQVGVATILSATLYEHLRKLDPSTIDVEALVASRPSLPSLQPLFAKRHGAFAEEAFEEFSKKYVDGETCRRELEWIVSNWTLIWDSLSMLRPAAVCRQVLLDAGAPTTVQELGLTPAHLRRSFLVAREIRGRFTVLDFAARLGVLERDCDAILDASGCAG